MPAYARGDLTIEGYLLRILTAIVRQSGGELRVKGELIDCVGEPTAIIKEWDQAKQELVLRSGMGSFVEIFKLNPEKQTHAETPRPVTAVDPLAKMFRDEAAQIDKTFTPKTSTVDNPNLAEMERKRNVVRAAAILKDELRRRTQEAI